MSCVNKGQIMGLLLILCACIFALSYGQKCDYDQAKTACTNLANRVFRSFDGLIPIGTNLTLFTADCMISDSNYYPPEDKCYYIYDHAYDTYEPILRSVGTSFFSWTPNRDPELMEDDAMEADWTCSIYQYREMQAANVRMVFKPIAGTCDYRIAEQYWLDERCMPKTKFDAIQGAH